MKPWMKCFYKHGKSKKKVKGGGVLFFNYNITCSSPFSSLFEKHSDFIRQCLALVNSYVVHFGICSISCLRRDFSAGADLFVPTGSLWHLDGSIAGDGNKRREQHQCSSKKGDGCHLTWMKMRHWCSKKGNEEKKHQLLPSAKIYIFLLLRSHVMTRQTHSEHEVNWFSCDCKLVIHFSIKKEKKRPWSSFEGRVQMSSCCSMATDAPEPCLIVL